MTRHDDALQQQKQQKQQDMKDMGLVDDVSQRVFRTSDGAISNGVWDVVSYTAVLNEMPHLRQTFYDAHIANNGTLTRAIHDQFRLEY